MGRVSPVLRDFAAHFKDLRRFTAGRASLPSYWRLDAFVEHQVDKNLTLKAYVNNIFNKLYYDTSKRGALRNVGAGSRRLSSGEREVLDRF
jgi:outer membrane receptor protein involved in Fe transport